MPRTSYMRTPAHIIALWFIIFFTFLALSCFRWGMREVKTGGNKSILRTTMILFVLFGVIAAVMTVAYLSGKFSEYN